MAKSQRSILLDEQIADWVDAHQSRTGATFTRIISAALLNYYFDMPDGPDDWWMQQVVAMSRDEMGFWNVPVERAQLRINMAKAALRRARTKGFPEEEIKRLEGDLEAYNTWKTLLLEQGFKEKPDDTKIVRTEDIERRHVSPEELAQTSELRDSMDDEGNKDD